MKRSDCFIVYSTRDMETARIIKDSLVKEGVTVCFWPDDLPKGDALEGMTEMLKSVDYCILLLSEHSIVSPRVEYDIKTALYTANDRQQRVIPVSLGTINLSNIPYPQILTYKILSLPSQSMENITSTARQISEIIKRDRKKERLYADLLELEKADEIRTAKTICKLLGILNEELQEAFTEDEKITILFQCDGLYLKLSHIFLGYGVEEKETAKIILNSLSKSNYLTDFAFLKDKELLAAAFSVRFLYFDREIRNYSVDIWTSGDYDSGCNPAYRESDYAEKQEQFRKLLLNQTAEADIYNEREIDFIEESKQFFFRPSGTEKRILKNEDPCIDSRFLEIADYLKKGNDLFHKLEKDKFAVSYIRCLLTSYERLKNYCLEVHANSIYGECVLKISELKDLLQDLHPSEKTETSFAEKGIKAFLGLTLPKSGQYDVFISYKHYDEDRAKRVYNYLHSNLKEVFFDSESLPELSKSDYEHAVMTALGHSQHFIVIISDLKLLESSDFIEGDWVRREMRTFNTEIQEGRKKDSNFIILASDEVCEQVFAENKQNIDIMWRWPEIIRFSEFESKLTKYIK